MLRSCLLALCLVPLAAMVAACNTSPVQAARAEVERVSPSTNERVPVVVELFTSQGCSSCPPADRLLAKLARGAAYDAEVIPLSFHVDYWDDLGWKDPFSSPRHSARQRWYASLAGQRGVYTPQMIVDGGRRFVGSNAGLAGRALERASKTKKPVHLEVSMDERVTYRVSGDVRNADLHLALVQRLAENEVSFGENAGTASTHVGVVREFDTRPLEGPGEGRWQPRLWEKVQQRRVVVFAQDRTTGRVLGAVSSG